MTKSNRELSRFFMCLASLACLFTGNGVAQSTANPPAQHKGFDSPEGWALKYFTSETMLSGLGRPVPPAEGYRIGSIAVGFEADWLPALTAAQARVGFSGRGAEEVNKAPILARPVVRVGLPWRFSVVVAGPPPFEVFGVSPRLFAFGLERPILETDHWRLGWRGSGQVGSVKGAFTCPQSVLGFAPGSPGNPSRCVGASADVASLWYGGTEFQFAYRMPKMPKLVPHLAGGVNFITGDFRVDAPLATRIDRSRLWTRGMTFDGTAGVSYLLSKRVAVTVDAFYSPLRVQRNPTGPTANDGLFNLRALVSYDIR